MNIELGDKVRDKIGGFTGIVNGYARWITGCDQASVRGESKDGKLGEAYWFDTFALEIIEKQAVKIDNPNARNNGGPPTPSPK